MEVMVGGAEVMQMTSEKDRSGCSTPERWECRIPAALVPPPPPKKKKGFWFGKKRQTPKNGYFQPPDLEEVFLALAPGRGAYA